MLSSNWVEYYISNNFSIIDTDGLICQALLAGNFEAAVDVCFGDQRMADGLLLAIAGGPDLFTKTQKRYLTLTKSPISKVNRTGNFSFCLFLILHSIHLVSNGRYLSVAEKIFLCLRSHSRTYSPSQIDV